MFGIKLTFCNWWVANLREGVEGRTCLNSRQYNMLNVETAANPHMGGGARGGAKLTPSPGWFSFNNSETVKAVTLAFCSV